jgi:hypothetical protein
MKRWLLFNSATAFIIAYLYQFYDGLNWLIVNDPTHLSLVIAAVYVLVSGYLGYGTFKGRINAGFVSWVPDIILGIGLVGTVVGMKILFGSLDFGDIKGSITQVTEGMAIATTTTAMALIASILLRVQNFFITGSTE